MNYYPVYINTEYHKTIKCLTWYYLLFKTQSICFHKFIRQFFDMRICTKWYLRPHKLWIQYWRMLFLLCVNVVVVKASKTRFYWVPMIDWHNQNVGLVLTICYDWKWILYSSLKLLYVYYIMNELCLCYLRTWLSPIISNISL